MKQIPKVGGAREKAAGMRGDSVQRGELDGPPGSRCAKDAHRSRPERRTRKLVREDRSTAAGQNG